MLPPLPTLMSQLLLLCQAQFYKAYLLHWVQISQLYPFHQAQVH